MGAPSKGLLEALKCIRDSGPVLHELGLCSNVRELTYPVAHDELMHGLFESWPAFSGRLDYPVPAVGCPEDWDAEDAYHHHTAGSMYGGEYGAARMCLLNFMIDELEKQDA